MDRLNHHHLPSAGDHVAALSIDLPGENGLFSVRKLSAIGTSVPLHLHGFDVERLSNSLRFHMINHGIPTAPIDASIAGANSTIEVFDVSLEQGEMTHVRSILSAAVQTPNNLAVTSNGGVLMTNDHSSKVSCQFSARLSAFSFTLLLLLFQQVFNYGSQASV